MNKEYIINLIDEINKLQLGSIVEITKDSKTHKYEVKEDNDFEDIELINLEEENTIWGSSGDTIEEVKEILLADGIRDRYQEINVINNKVPSIKVIKVKYKNWKGETGIRTIIPKKVWYGHTDYHLENQWLMDVWDVDKNNIRTYAMIDILEFIK